MAPQSEKRPILLEIELVQMAADPGGLLGSIFAGYVPLASPNPYPIIVYSVASYRPHVNHFWANIPQIPTCLLLKSRKCVTPL